MIHCALPGCGFDPDLNVSYRFQYDSLRQHWKSEHNLPPNPSQKEFFMVIHKLWDLLDNYMDQGMNWPTPERPTDPWADDREWQLILSQNDLAKAKAVSAGRGVAEALTLLLHGYFTHSDQVAQLAYERWLARTNGTEMPVTPGLEGAGGTMPKDYVAPSEPPVNQFIAAAAAEVATVPTVLDVMTPEQVAAAVPAPPVVAPPVITPPAVAAPVAVAEVPLAAPAVNIPSALAKFTEEQIQRIREARDSGFDAATVAEMFGITTGEVIDL